MSDVRNPLRLKRQANEFSLQITERTNRFRSDANSELNRLESELAQAEEILRGRRDVMVTVPRWWRPCAAPSTTSG